MGREIMGSQSVLIEIVRLQLKMGEMIARTNGRIDKLEVTAELLLDGEFLEEFKKHAAQACEEMTETNDELKEQVRVTLDALERHMND